MDAAALERLQARHEADLRGVGLGVEVAHEEGREAAARALRQHELAERHHLTFPHAPVMELPVRWVLVNATGPSGASTVTQIALRVSPSPESGSRSVE